MGRGLELSMPQAKDLVPIVISLVALVVSLWSAQRGWRYNLASLRRTARAGYMTALLDIDRQLITNPQLWRVYGVDFSASPGTGASAPDLEAGRRLAFIWYHLNLYELVFSEFHAHRVAPLDRDEREFWVSWDKYIRLFLDRSAEARELVASDESMKLLNQNFVEYVRGCVKSSQVKRTTT
jgi:hypothetical protein